MYEKVNPAHPDKIADRIAGALVDLAYSKQENPKVAVEVLIGHGKCHVIIESTVQFYTGEVRNIVERIAGEDVVLDLTTVAQDEHLTKNQSEGVKCGDNGIFKGTLVTEEQQRLTEIAKDIYFKYPYDGKYILADDQLIICQSNTDSVPYNGIVNPLGYWTGGIDVDSGATNRKLGSDMGDSVTGGGLHGKDLSKADVSVNIYAWLLAQTEQRDVLLHCAIGDDTVDGKPYAKIVDIARQYIKSVGGFEKFAEWGLIR